MLLCVDFLRNGISGGFLTENAVSDCINDYLNAGDVYTFEWGTVHLHVTLYMPL